MTTEPKCTKCLQRLEPGAKFCGTCGTEVKEVVSPSAVRQASPIPGIECPACNYYNVHTARFCEGCGTEIQSSEDAAVANEQAQAHAGHAAADSRDTEARPFDYARAENEARAATEDPWATGPAYEQPYSGGEECSRCGTFNDRNATSCANCGLPFAQRVNYAGVPTAVAEQGVPAGFWIRFVAAIVDGLIVFAISLPFAIISIFADSNVATLMDLIQFAIGLLYAPIFLSRNGTTPGKKLFNIYVLDSKGDRPLSFGVAFVREIAKILSTLTLMIGYIMAGFRKDKRALHDLIAGTYPTVIN